MSGARPKLNSISSTIISEPERFTFQKTNSVQAGSNFAPPARARGAGGSAGPERGEAPHPPRLAPTSSTRAAPEGQRPRANTPQAAGNCSKLLEAASSSFE
eukprot:11274329-Alexandrium_andersonii.AAC.1